MSSIITILGADQGIRSNVHSVKETRNSLERLTSGLNNITVPALVAEGSISLTLPLAVLTDSDINGNDIGTVLQTFGDKINEAIDFINSVWEEDSAPVI